MKNLKLLSRATALAALISLAGCQKDQKPASTVEPTDGITKHTYTYQDTSKHKFLPPVNGNSLASTPAPYIDLGYGGGATATSAGDYGVIAYNNRTGNQYYCSYSMYYNGTPTSFNTYQNEFTAGGDGTGFSFNFIPPQFGTYNVQITYESGPLEGDGPFSDTFTIYTEPLPPTGLVAFYRYINDLNGGIHFYTSDWQEVASGGNGVRFEKVQGYLYPNSTAAPSLAPLYRFNDAATGDHMYTVGTSELGGNRAWTNEGITGYISTISQGSFTTPLNRYFNGHYHFFCSPPENPIPDGFHLEGTVGYIESPN